MNRILEAHKLSIEIANHSTDEVVKAKALRIHELMALEIKNREWLTRQLKVVGTNAGDALDALNDMLGTNINPDIKVDEKG